MNDNILKVRNLKTYFYTSSGVIKAVDGVSFDIKKRETFGLVGGSGSGKTLTALSILKLIPRQATIVDGEVIFNDTDILKADKYSIRDIRGAKISMVFQEPASALNPVFTIKEQMVESVLAHQGVSRSNAEEIALKYLNRVHIPDPAKIFHDYPHQLSGGMKQRVMIAMALLNSPELVILDEPTTALDVTIQAQVLDLLDEILAKEKISILFISHDFGIIARTCDRIAIMRKGEIVETGDRDGILYNPKHPYTISLLESVKVLS